MVGIKRINGEQPVGDDGWRKISPGWPPKPPENGPKPPPDPPEPLPENVERRMRLKYYW